MRAIGSNGSTVGLAALNAWFRHLTGVHMALYHITDYLGLLPLGIAAGFALPGLRQWIERRSIRKVDRSILALGGFYILVLSAYLLFEVVPVNYRPVLIGGCLEVSYPSSTTMLTLCILPTAMMQVEVRLRRCTLKWVIHGALLALAAFLVVGRLLSGVHWLTDIVGGVLLSAGLVALYAAVSGL